MKRFIIVLGLLIVVAAVVCVGGQRLMGRPESEPEAVVLDQEAAASVERVLKARGQVVPGRVGGSGGRCRPIRRCVGPAGYQRSGVGSAGSQG